MTEQTYYYYMNKEHGYLVAKWELYDDAMSMCYDDVTDPTSVEYLNFSLHYTKTRYVVK